MTPHLRPLRSYLELGALPTAVPCARLHARQLVWEWGLNGLAANTELLVSELVTNAVKTTAGNDDQAAICLQLCLIAALSTRWAWYLTEKPTGKVGADLRFSLEYVQGAGLVCVCARPKSGCSPGGH
jgi:hypothetical protein